MPLNQDWSKPTIERRGSGDPKSRSFRVPGILARFSDIALSSETPAAKSDKSALPALPAFPHSLR
jgi:hypothetical protein